MPLSFRVKFNGFAVWPFLAASVASYAPHPSLDPAVPDNLQLHLLPPPVGPQSVGLYPCFGRDVPSPSYVAGWYLLPRLSPGFFSRGWGEMACISQAGLGAPVWVPPEYSPHLLGSPLSFQSFAHLCVSTVCTRSGSERVLGFASCPSHLGAH